MPEPSTPPEPAHDLAVVGKTCGGMTVVQEPCEDGLDGLTVN